MTATLQERLDEYKLLMEEFVVNYQYNITLPYTDSDNVVFTLVEHRVNIGLNHLLIDLADDNTNQIQFFSCSSLSYLQALLPSVEIVQEY